MAQFLALQIKIGRITIDQVPDKYRAEVEAVMSH